MEGVKVRRLTHVPRKLYSEVCEDCSWYSPVTSPQSPFSRAVGVHFNQIFLEQTLTSVEKIRGAQAPAQVL